jgi:uncharacterized protein YcbK (DUF882 family)
MMLIENGYYVWNKGERHKLSQFFSTHEFDCQCSNKECVKQKISVDLIDKLNLVRIESKSPLYITSGFRCKAHQTSLREQLNKGKKTLTVVAAQTSQHELGNAADISPRLITIAKLRTIVEQVFDTIGLAKTFLHVDTRPKKQDGTKRLWDY